MARNYVLRSRLPGVAEGDGGFAVPSGQFDERRDAVADARASGHRPAPALALLSMGHISSPSRKLSVWIDGARADFPSCPDPRFPDGWSPPAQTEIPKRGEVTEFSRKSRTRLVRMLSTMRRDETSFTMALTVVRQENDDIEALNALLMDAFPRLKRRLANLVRFKGVSGFWKREFHKSGVVHFHLILFGLADENLRADFQAWTVAQWVSLVGGGLTDEKREHLRWWHAREQNMEQIRTFSYFAKYVGVPEESGALTGRWWGCFNKERLPEAPKSETEQMPENAVAMLARLARRRQRGRADEAKHREISKACGLVDGAGNPHVSRFWVNHARQRAGKKLKIPAGASLADIPPGRIYDYLLAREILAIQGRRWGKAKRWHRKSAGAPMIICDPTAPAFAGKALEFVAQALGLDLPVQETSKLSRETFTPDPLRPVPPGRMPRNPERVRSQADFFGALGKVSGQSALYVQMEHDIPHAGRRSCV